MNLCDTVWPTCTESPSASDKFMAASEAVLQALQMRVVGTIRDTVKRNTRTRAVDAGASNRAGQIMKRLDSIHEVEVTARASILTSVQCDKIAHRFTVVAGY